MSSRVPQLNVEVELRYGKSQALYDDHCYKAFIKIRDNTHEEDGVHLSPMACMHMSCTQ